MTDTTLLFCDPVSAERARWVTECISASVHEQPEGSSGRVRIFLSGDAVFSLVDTRTRGFWQNLARIPLVEIIADGDEMHLQGVENSVASGPLKVTITGHGPGESFWVRLVKTLKEEWKDTRRAGFLLCTSPYMSRVPVHMVRFLALAHDAGLSPELYTYLDGVHTLHNGQRPSEFENIGRAVSALAGTAAESGQDPYFAACSRCATARGYYQMNPGTGFCEPSSCIEDITIRPLKEILGRFTGRHPILSHACGGIVSGTEGDADPPRLVVFITYPPYYTEWTFGGLSLAVAAAMDRIPTTVIFIEEGVYALCGDHRVPPHEKVFNVQEMISATTDVPDLRYLVYAPSLAERGVETSPGLSMIGTIQSTDLAGIVGGADLKTPSYATRIFFF